MVRSVSSVLVRVVRSVVRVVSFEESILSWASRGVEGATKAVVAVWNDWGRVRVPAFVGDSLRAAISSPIFDSSACKPDSAVESASFSLLSRSRSYRFISSGHCVDWDTIYIPSGGFASSASGFSVAKKMLPGLSLAKSLDHRL